MNYKTQAIEHISRHNLINGIEDNVNDAAEQVAIVAMELQNNPAIKKHDCIIYAYQLYVRSFDSIKWANMFNEMIEKGRSKQSLA
jgi:hypothetical protein